MCTVHHKSLDMCAYIHVQCLTERWIDREREKGNEIGKLNENYREREGSEREVRRGQGEKINSSHHYQLQVLRALLSCTVEFLLLSLHLTAAVAVKDKFSLYTYSDCVCMCVCVPHPR